jgi:hypothetical protein
MIVLPMFMGSSPRPEFRRDDPSVSPDTLNVSNNQSATTRPPAYRAWLNRSNAAPPSYAAVLREHRNSEDDLHSPSELEAGTQEHALFPERPAATAQRGTRLRNLNFNLPRVAAHSTARPARGYHAYDRGGG